MAAFSRKKPRSPKERHERLGMAVGAIGLVALTLLGAYIAFHYTPPTVTPCEYVEGLCVTGRRILPSSVSRRQYTDKEVAAIVVAREILAHPRPLPLPVPRIAFLYLTPGPMPLEFVWEEFFKGHEGKYSIYLHASEVSDPQKVLKSKVFLGRAIPSSKVYWGTIGMIDAEKRLLAYALMDPDNYFFVLLSDSCIPLHDFAYIYRRLLQSTYSFVDNFDDPGPHGIGRYMEEKMMPEIRQSDWRKGAQWFAIMRKHASLLVLDHLYYEKFKEYCKERNGSDDEVKLDEQPGDEYHNCYPDEHYVQTYLHIMDAGGLSNWSVTYVDWSSGGWHPKAYLAEDMNVQAIQKIQEIDKHVHVSSDARATQKSVPCMWEGEHRPCFLFARKFLPETAGNLTLILPHVIPNNITTVSPDSSMSTNSTKILSDELLG